MNTSVMMYVMDSCHNHFINRYFTKEITINNGAISGVNLGGCLYCIITGSTRHDGLWEVRQYGTEALIVGNNAPDEKFYGQVTLISPPQHFIELCNRISDWIEKNGSSPMQQESFGEYSYTKATGSNGNLTWVEAFANELRPYRVGMYSDMPEVYDVE